MKYWVEDHENGTLRANGNGGPPRTDKHPLVVSGAITSTVGQPDDQDTTRLVVSAPEVATTLTAGGHPNSNVPGRRKEDDENLVVERAFSIVPEGGQGADLRAAEITTAPPITKVTYGLGTDRGVRITRPGDVRRLTPRECERLQGFPDDWTLVEWRGKPAPDTRRYAALGDAVTVNVAEWLGRRIIEAFA